jgi:hypothetical protein
MNIQMKKFLREARVRALIAIGASSLAFAVSAQSVTGAMSPASVTAGGSSGLRQIPLA